MTMECQVLREDMVDVLYGEASADAERRLAEHVALCASCREELAAFRGVRRDLAEWKLPALGQRKPVFAGRRPGLWLAAAASLLLACGAAIGLSGSELRYEQGRVAFRLGRGPDVQQLLDQQQASHDRELAALRAALSQAGAGSRHDDAALLQDMQAIVRESEARQAERLSASLKDLQAKTEEQRRYDLARVSAGLSYLDGKTGQHVARTSELMGYVLQAAEKK
jgi:hypothetical protein